MQRPRRWLLAAAGSVMIVVIAVIAVRYGRPRLSQEQIRERVIATIQSEAKQSFLVTGSVDLTVTTSVENTRVFLPGLLDINVGTSRALVQVPGRAYYGFDVRRLDANRIHVRGDTVRIQVPEPTLLSVAPNLSELRVWTQKGWLRTPASVDAAERGAIRRIDTALARQAAAHVATSAQPHVNSAHALEEMLEPVLIAAGIVDPVFSFQIGERLRLDD